MWIARDDKSKILNLFTEKPKREIYGYWYADFGQEINLDNDLFPNLTWEDEPIEVTILPRPTIDNVVSNPVYHTIYDMGKEAGINYKNKLQEQVIKETTHGITNKELRDLLSQYPDDAMVAVECCDIRKMTYNKEDNSIRID